MIRKKTCSILSCILFIVLSLPGKSYCADNKCRIYTINLQSGISDTTDQNSKLQKESIRKMLSDMFSGYLKIKNSLSINDSVAAKTQASQLLQELESSLDKIDKKNVSRSLESFIKNIPRAKSSIASSNSLSQQRYLFGILSDYIIDFIKTYGLKNKTVYILKCKSRLIQGSGEWLSNSFDGKNPFLGPGNENCIEVSDTKVY